MRGLLAGVSAALLLSACGGGSASPASTPTPTQTPTPTPLFIPVATPTPVPNPLAAFAAAVNGRYSGTWTNTTFGSTGPIAVQVIIDPATGSLVASNLTLGGNVFGAAAPAPESLVLTGMATGTVRAHSANFGDISMTISPTGAVAGTCINIPSDRVAQVSFSGTLADPTKFTLAYHVDLKDGTAADGAVTMAKT